MPSPGLRGLLSGHQEQAVQSSLGEAGGEEEGRGKDQKLVQPYLAWALTACGWSLIQV